MKISALLVSSALLAAAAALTPANAAQWDGRSGNTWNGNGASSSASRNAVRRDEPRVTYNSGRDRNDNHRYLDDRRDDEFRHHRWWRNPWHHRRPLWWSRNW